MDNRKRYSIVFSKTFKKEFEKLSGIHKAMVLEKFLIMEQNPFYPSLRTKKMKGRNKHFESSVNMDIRILWRFRDSKIIAALDVGHHDILNKY
jgi:mRNA-degrading endonuclease RelE of RelBE toxin-antitoxin system